MSNLAVGLRSPSAPWLMPRLVVPSRVIPTGSRSAPDAAAATPDSPAPYQLRLLGPEGERIRSVLSQPKRLRLLAYLCLADGPVSRAHLVALFWPENNEERARNALSQAVHYLRRSLAKAAIESVEGDRLQVSATRVACDAEALLAGRDETFAPEAGERELFQGWNADDSQPLQDWWEGVRRRGREALVRSAGSSGVAHAVDSPEGLAADRP